jgi:hypothetical protein
VNDEPGQQGDRRGGYSPPIRPPELAKHLFKVNKNGQQNQQQNDNGDAQQRADGLRHCHGAGVDGGVNGCDYRRGRPG